MKVLITTAREPSRRTRSFLNDLTASVPHSLRITRGKATLHDLYLTAKKRGAYGVIIIFQSKANPSALTYFSVRNDGLLKKYLLKLSGLSLLREIKDSQRPLNIRGLVMNISTLSRDVDNEVVEALIEMFRPSIINEDTKDMVRDTIELIVGGNKELIVSFICSSTGRMCGPRFRVLKVIKYDWEV